MLGKVLSSLSCAALVLVLLVPCESAAAPTVRVWQTVSALDDFDTGDALWPAIASDENGNAIAVWEQKNATISTVWADRFVPDIGWKGPVQISKNTIVNASGPRIDMDGEGNAFVVWWQGVPSLNNIFAARYVRGSGWDSPQNVSQGLTYVGDADVACGRNGTAFAAWVEVDHIIASRYDPIQGWGDPFLVSPNHSHAQAPRIDADDQGNAIVVWTDPTSAVVDLWSNRYSSASGWGTQTLAENNDTGNATDQSVAMDDFGNAIVVWQQYVGYPMTSMTAWGNNYSLDSGWGEPRLLKNDTTHFAGRPKVGMDAYGNATVAFDLTAAMDFIGVWTIRYSVISGWDPEALHIPGTNGAETDLAVNEAGQAIVIWRLGEVWSNTYEPSSGWSEPRQVAPHNNNINPVVSIDRDGDAVAAWMVWDGTYWSVHANQYGFPQPSITLRSPTEGQVTDQQLIWVSGTTDSGARVDINGVLVLVDSDGTFNASVPLKYGNNQLIVRSSLDFSSKTMVVNVMRTNPVPGLQAELNETKAGMNQTKAELNQTKAWLNQTNAGLNDTRSELHDAEATANLFMITTGVAAAVAIAVAVLYAIQRRKTP